jgi:hypothetical protein
MIISASRRTDIPAYYSEWFMNRIRAGYCLVPNPYNPRQVTRVSLRPESVEAIVFWSKNPAPMLKHVPDLEGAGARFYFQYTLNPYPPEFEPNVGLTTDRIRTFLALADAIGPDRIIWRYDPIILSSLTTAAFHRRHFADLCRALTGHTRRVVVSIVDYYAKTTAAFGRLAAAGLGFPEDPLQHPDLIPLLQDMAGMAQAAGLEIQSCAEEHDLHSIGISAGRCIDGELINRLCRTTKTRRKDPHQRKACGCVVSQDIGINNTCPAGCVYCYATGNPVVAAQLRIRHDPAAEALPTTRQAEPDPDY